MEQYFDQADREFEMLAQLEQPAKWHVDQSAGRLALLPVDPDKYPGQRGFYISGQPVGPMDIDFLASSFVNQYPDLRLQVDNELQDGYIVEAGELLDNRGNIIVATNHTDITDIAVAEAAVYSKLGLIGVRPRTAIVISKLVSRVGVNMGGDEPIPAVAALQYLCRDIFLSYPPSGSLQGSELATTYKTDVKDHNKEVRKSVASLLNEGHILLGIAPSGTTDKLIQENVYEMGRAIPSTERMMLHAGTYALGLAILLGGDKSNSFLKISGPPRELRSEQDIHKLMSVLADVLSYESGAGSLFTYAPAPQLSGDVNPED